jgi:curved DNA-binding protein CbpA
MSDYNPYLVLGLPVRPDVTDDEVRAAWRRIAAATHPDLPDGGDPGRFAEAAAAYADLRTGYGRTEAYADLFTSPSRISENAAVARNRADAAAASAAPARKVRVATTRLTRLLRRARRGRPAILALRLLVATALVAIAVTIAGWQPATLAIAVGAFTWLTLTARYDLAPKHL